MYIVAMLCGKPGRSTHLPPRKEKKIDTVGNELNLI